jgi:hypothetical protein
MFLILILVVKGQKMLQYIILVDKDEIQDVINHVLSLGLSYDQSLVDNEETGMYSIKITVHYETPLFTLFNDRTIHWSYYGKTI